MTKSNLIQNLPGVPLIARSINTILAKLGLKLLWKSSLANLENQLQIEEQKNQTLTHELDAAKVNLAHYHQLKELVYSGQVINDHNFFTTIINKLEFRNIDNLLNNQEVKTIYSHTLRDAVLVLSNEEFELLTLEVQIKLMEKIFFAILNLQHPNGNLVADLIANHYERILRNSDLQKAMGFKIYEYLYGLYWCGASSLGDMKKFDAMGVRPFAKYVKEQLLASTHTLEYVLKTEHPLKICYFCHYANFDKGNAISPIIMSLAKAHAWVADRRIFIYCVQWAHDEFAEAFADTDVVVRLLAQQSEYESVDNIIAQMKADEIDVVITDISSSIATYIYLHRAAPLQMWLELGYPYWSISQVDWVFLCAKDYQSGFGIPADRCSSLMPMQEEVTLLQECSESVLNDAKSSLPQDSIIFAVFTRLIKITPAYLDIVHRILLDNQNAHFLVVGTGDPRLIYSFIADQTINGRVTFLHRNVDLNVYGRIVDIFLDTFPFIGGNACREVSIHGKPIVSLYTLDFGRLLLDERDRDLLAMTADEYVAIAQRLATDIKFYQDKSEMAINLAKKSTNVTEAVANIDKVIQEFIIN